MTDEELATRLKERVKSLWNEADIVLRGRPAGAAEAAAAAFLVAGFRLALAHCGAKRAQELVDQLELERLMKPES
jgi:hypothetical protein